MKRKIKEYWEKATPMVFVPERWPYEKKREFRYGLQDYMHRVFGFKDWVGRRVLDYGCGAGIDSLEFARHGALVTAVDITDNAVMATRSLSDEAGISLDVVQIEEGHSLPFDTGAFDCVYSFGVLHHIPVVDDVMLELARVLKPGGTIMAMLYHQNSLLYAYSIIYQHGIAEGLLEKGYKEKDLVGMFSERFVGCPYTRVYTKAEAHEFFSRFFADVEVSVHYNVVDHPKQRKVKLLVDDKWELGWHIVVKGKKPA